MSEMKELRELLRSIETAQAPSPEIDAAIYNMLAGDPLYRAQRFDDYADRFSDGWCVANGRYRDPLPRYTRSLDAITLLIEALLPKWRVGIVEKHNSRGRWECYVHNDEPVFQGMYAQKNPKQRWITTHGDSAPLALCAALVDAVMTVKAIAELERTKVESQAQAASEQSQNTSRGA